MFKSKKLICSISGGVDSAVSALLLKQKGYEVLGVYMRNWDTKDELGHCQADEDASYAQRVCKTLDIPLTEVNFVKEYWTGVFSPMVDKIGQGYSMNPDVYCNQKVKFDALHKKCEEIYNTKDFVVATGHYAGTSLGERVLREAISPEERVYLLRSEDTYKDQTLFLHQITEESLRRTYFPLQHYLKGEVKEIAKNSDINFTLNRKESTGICFIGKRNFSGFIEKYIAPRMGNFIGLETKKVMGQHRGQFKYTIGQKSRISGADAAYAVLHCDAKSGDIVVVKGTEHDALYSRSMLTHPIKWVTPSPEYTDRTTFRCQLRQNHRYPLVDCTVHIVEDDKALIIADFPLLSLTAGQDAILYDGDICLGGGRIDAIGPSLHEIRDYSEHGVQYGWYRDDVELWRALVDRFPAALTAAKTDEDANLMGKVQRLRVNQWHGSTKLTKQDRLELECL